MGLYINVAGDNKLQWLNDNGKQIEDALLLDYEFGSFEPNLPVIYVRNRGFDAAGIAYSKRELMRFLVGIEGRPYAVFLVPKTTLREWCSDPETMQLEDDKGL